LRGAERAAPPRQLRQLIQRLPLAAVVTSLAGAKWAHPHTGTGTWAHPTHIGTGTGLTPATSAPGLGPPHPHLHRDWARFRPTTSRGTRCTRGSRLEWTAEKPNPPTATGAGGHGYQEMGALCASASRAAMSSTSLNEPQITLTILFVIRFQSDLPNHRAIVKPRLYECPMVTQIKCP
jgi:hypothetical protein